VEAAVVFELLQKMTFRRTHAFINYEESAPRTAARGNHFSQRRIAGIKSTPGKVDRVMELCSNGLMNRFHQSGNSE
jgi:hypothetical protein